MPKPYPWRTFSVLLAAGILAAVLLLPYLQEMAQRSPVRAARSLPPPTLLQLSASVIQSAVLLAVATGVGLLLARKIGLVTDVPFPARPMLLRATIAGVVSALVAVGLLVWVFIPRIPQLLAANEHQYPVWKRFLAAFYGGIAEEILFRLFVMTLLAWLIGKVWYQANGLPAAGALWTANVLAAVLFGLGHLPTALMLGIPVTAMVVADAVVVNGILGVTFGWLYIGYGIEAAMVAHFCADIVLHVAAPQFVRHT